MVKHRKIDGICIAAVVLAAAITVLLMAAAAAGILKTDSKEPEYARRLFDDSYVHTIDIQIDDWERFIKTAGNETYSSCAVLIDGEDFHQVGLRAKGNNSRRLTEEYGLSRYSLKLEFDHFLDGGSYYGLDKFSLDSSFQDNSYMKTYIAYDMMAFMEVPSPLCSYVWVTVNGEDWGLFLAVEEPEEAFARRNFGKDHGILYKPDYHSLNDENADVALQYIDDDPESYPGIFENAKFKISESDEERLISALKTISEGENLETVVNVDEVLRYFAVQVFVMNWDSYLGHTGHNYFLYEEDGVLSMLPWDYNLAFGTYALGMTDPVKDPYILINYPVNTPAAGDIMLNRPLYHNLMKHDDYFVQYHENFDRLLSEYFENGRFEAVLRQTERMIAPYVEKDPTAFCSFGDYQAAVDMLERICVLRAESVRGQLEGLIPSTLRSMQEQPDAGVDVSDVDIAVLGDFYDLESAKGRQDAALGKTAAD
jgi:spore coat protein CotH